MTKALKVVSSLLIVLLLLVGCQTSNVITVSTTDENYDNEQKERYDEIREYLSDEYGDDLDEMKKDDLYEEYSQLSVQYGIGNSEYSVEKRKRFSGTVDLDNYTIAYDYKIIDYEYTSDGMRILNNNTELLDDTFVSMVNIAEKEFREKKEANKELLISAGWLPIVLFIIALTA